MTSFVLKFKLVGARLKTLRQGSALCGQTSLIVIGLYKLFSVVFRTSWNWWGTHDYEFTEAYKYNIGVISNLSPFY